VGGRRELEPDAELPLAARDALVELLLCDLVSSSPRAADGVVAHAVRLLADAPSAYPGGAAASVDLDVARARDALVMAGLLDDLDPTDAVPHGGAAVRAARAAQPWASSAAARLAAYAGALSGAPRGSDLATRLAQARHLFARQLFFEVHEVLEPAWQCAAGAERRHLQGVIQAAVAWHHGARGNASGAQRLAMAAQVKLADAPDAWMGFPLRELRASLGHFIARLAAGASADPPILAWAAR